MRSAVTSKMASAAGTSEEADAIVIPAVAIRAKRLFLVNNCLAISCPNGRDLF
jgi:hypothetical protein